MSPPVPPRGIVRRSRLFARLGARQTVVLSGTAGYGKSVLIASWLTEAALPGAVAWLTIDPSDGDPARLTADVLASLRASELEALTESLVRVQAPPLFADPLGVIDSVHEALYDSGVPLTLVLDDVHHLAQSARACAVLDHFLQWAPSSTRVILAGRTLPPLRLQRMRLEDRLEVIGHRDLAFTPEETSEVVVASGLDIDATTVGALQEVTQGWPAGVRLAVLAMRARASRDLPRELRRDDALADYLTAEVLASLDDELRSFVLEATVDELVCPGLVDAVRGTRDAGVLLERCVGEGLFLTREDGADDGDWYRWHSLFAAHMRGRRWALGQGRAEAIERAAACWWEGVDPATAVSHALAAGDAELAGAHPGVVVARVGPRGTARHGPVARRLDPRGNPR